MTIAFLCRYFGIVDRGAEVFVKEVSTRLTAMGHQVHVLPSANHLGSVPAQIVISTNGRLDALAAKAWSLSHGAKLIIPGQSGIGWDDRLNLWTFPSQFVALTAHQQAWATRANPFVVTTVIPNGVDIAKFHPQVPPFKTRLPPPVVLSVGALTESKRHELVLQAAHRLGISVLLVGRGERESALLAMGEHLLKDRFHLLSLPHSQVPSVYTAAQVFAFPTVPWEAFGIVMLEAMASGLPVVASDDPIRREIVGPAGLFADPADTDKFSASLWKAVKTDWHHAPRVRAESFSWESIAARYHHLCQSLISSPS